MYKVNRYIVAMMCSCDLKKRILENPNGLSLIHQIGKSIYEDDLIGALQENGLNYLELKSEGIVINQEKLDELVGCYLEEYRSCQKEMSYGKKL